MPGLDVQLPEPALSQLEDARGVAQLQLEEPGMPRNGSLTTPSSLKLPEMAKATRLIAQRDIYIDTTIAIARGNGADTAAARCGR